MPLDRFNIVDDIGGTSPDRTGPESPDAVSARREAPHLAGPTTADRASGHRLERRHLDVTSRDGEPRIAMDLPSSSAMVLAE